MFVNLALKRESGVDDHKFCKMGEWGSGQRNEWPFSDYSHPPVTYLTRVPNFSSFCIVYCESL